MPSNLNERFTQLAVQYRVDMAFQQWRLLDMQYVQIKQRVRTAKARGRTALYLSLKIRKQCIKEARAAYIVYLLHNAVRYLELLGLNAHDIATMRNELPTLLHLLANEQHQTP